MPAARRSAAELDITKGQAGPHDPAIANFRLNSIFPSAPTSPASPTRGAMVAALTDWNSSQSGVQADGIADDAFAAAVASVLQRPNTSPTAVDQVFATQNAVEDLWDV